MRISDWSSDVCSSDLNGRHSGGERCAKSVSDGRLVQGTERRQIGVVARRDLAGMADRKEGHMPLGLGVPQRLVGLAETGEQQRARLALFVERKGVVAGEGCVGPLVSGCGGDIKKKKT